MEEDVFAEGSKEAGEFILKMENQKDNTVEPSDAEVRAEEYRDPRPGSDAAVRSPAHAEGEAAACI